MEIDRLYNQDCIEGMQALADGSVDLAFADPPFNIGYDYDVYGDRLAAEEYLAWTTRWGQALVRALKPTGTFWLAIGDDFAAELKMIFQRQLNLTCRSWVIWYYTFGVNCKTKFSRSHTHLFHFTKDPKAFTFNADAIRVPSARQLVYADVRADSRGRLPDDTWILRPQDLPGGFGPEADTWYFPRVCGTFKERAGWHGCQMPEQLLGRIIKACSHPDELVLDPFGGSGTTLAVAKKLGRKFLGFELSANYASQIQARLTGVRVGDPLSGAEEPNVSAPSTAKGKRRPVQKPAAPVEAIAAPVTAIPSPELDGVNRGVIQAFLEARDGFSVDRVIADRDLNAEFAAACARLGLPGKPADWNRRLMSLRKGRHFRGLPRSKVTAFPLEEAEFEKYKFACEIAMQRFDVEGHSLDNVLCDPELARRFDKLALSMIPEPLSSLKIRCFALRLRKRARDYRTNARALLKVVPLPRKFSCPFDLLLLRVPASPGLYWLRRGDRRLYVGETRNLRERLQVQFSSNTFDFWGEDRRALQLGYQAVDSAELVAPNQSVWIGRWNPEGNWASLGVPPT